MEIFWTDFAIQNLKEIIDYHNKVAGPSVSIKIQTDIFTAVKHLIKNPEMGVIEPYLKGFPVIYRYILSKNYKIIYRIENRKIFITDIFDTRQNPNKISRSEQ
ncbi:type II toxin-antitoxin system RelE/ParE family toxin [Salegentibacter sp. HM20]